MLILDTCSLIFDALTPDRLSAPAVRAIAQGNEKGELVCCDISLWEIAMLMAKKRIDPQTSAETFLRLIVTARKISVLPITTEIAAKSASSDFCPHGDPADRIIAATAVIHNAPLVTSDRRLATIPELQTLW